MKRWYLFIAGLIVILFIILSVKIKVQKENIHYHQTTRQMTDFANYFCSIGFLEKIEPEKNLNETVNKLLCYSDYKNRLTKKCSMIINGKDAWGQPFIYNLFEDEKILVLRSVGKNGLDEDGKDDDIQITIDYRFYNFKIFEESVELKNLKLAKNSNTI